MTLSQTLPVTAHIDRLIAEIPGWTPPDQLLALHLLAVDTAPRGGDILEIGSWCGRSTAVLGHAVRLSGTGHVWAVDLFPTKQDWSTNEDGSHSFTVSTNGQSFGGYQDQTVWDEPFQRDIATVYEVFEGSLDAFNAAIEREQLTGLVTPHRGTGETFAREAAADLKVRLAFLDGDHSYDAVCSDINTTERFLMPGGWITFDDAFSVYDGVNAAIRDRIINNPAYDCAQQVSRKFFAARRR